MSESITFSIPEPLAKPKFQLFQSVVIKPEKRGEEALSGTIVGISYTTLFVAIADGVDAYGWEYKVDFYFGSDFEALLHTDEAEITRTFHESQLEG
jgi:hypothetical protein